MLEYWPCQSGWQLWLSQVNMGPCPMLQGRFGTRNVLQDVYKRQKIILECLQQSHYFLGCKWFILAGAQQRADFKASEEVNAPDGQEKQALGERHTEIQRGLHNQESIDDSSQLLLKIYVPVGIFFVLGREMDKTDSRCFRVFLNALKISHVLSK